MFSLELINNFKKLNILIINQLRCTTLIKLNYFNKYKICRTSEWKESEV